MDETTLIKVEENNFKYSCSGDACVTSSASGSPPTSLHQPENDPLKIETTTGRVVKIKHEQSLAGEPLILNQEKDTVQQQSPTVHGPDKYRCELCISDSDGNKLKLYPNKQALGAHMRYAHSSTRRFKCELCLKPFNFLSHFKRHSQVHQVKKVKIKLNQTLSFKSFKCELCFENFTTKANLNLHLVQNHNHSSEGLNLFQCKLCITAGQTLKYFATKQRLRVHLGNAHRSAPRFKCEVCFKQFNSVSNFKKHSRGHLNQTLSFKCKICSLALTSKFSLNVHLVRVHNYNSKKLNVKVFPCDLCSHTSFSKSALEQHVVKNHVVDKPLECHVCSKTFMDHDDLSKHLKGHDKQPCYKCDVCSKAFKVKQALLHHLGVEHHQFFRCDKCKISFSNKSEFDAHLKLLSQNEFSCQICSLPFRSQCSLSVHIECHNLTELQNEGSDLKASKVKNNFGEFKCDICLKTFDREAYIVSHRTLVHPNSQWPCSKCSKTFKMRSHMKLHELTHQEVKPHACKSCDKSYCKAYELKVHENNAHSSTKHFKCQQCPESFATRFSLKLHMGNFHGGEKPFKCHLCSTSCVTEGYLKRHLISHRTEKLFPCEICSKSFKDLKTSKKHFREVHVIRAAKKQEKIRKREEALRELLVFVCNLCSFETQEDKEVAAHYNSHGLPKITLFREPFTSAAVKHNSPQTTHLGRNMKLVRCIEKRYKCSTCSKLFNSPEHLRIHSYSHSKPN